VERLRQNFTGVFSRLARKEDLIVDALIDDATFEVTLVGKDGARIPKQSLSAGEKQIYAIAMLEALAKTSGRSLPIIIDTPLGRLDGPHRKKLVNHYFPRASHQVIILSTDTEVDQNFYRDLSPLCPRISFDFDENEEKVWRRDISEASRTGVETCFLIDRISHRATETLKLIRRTVTPNTCVEWPCFPLRMGNKPLARKWTLCSEFNTPTLFGDFSLAYECLIRQVHGPDSVTSSGWSPPILMPG
jgi:hypothetical protein